MVEPGLKREKTENFRSQKCYQVFNIYVCIIKISTKKRRPMPKYKIHLWFSLVVYSCYISTCKMMSGRSEMEGIMPRRDNPLFIYNNVNNHSATQ